MKTRRFNLNRTFRYVRFVGLIFLVVAIVNTLFINDNYIYSHAQLLIFSTNTNSHWNSSTELPTRPTSFKASGSQVNEKVVTNLHSFAAEKPGKTVDRAESEHLLSQGVKTEPELEANDPDPDNDLSKPYDVCVIGAGLSGAVLAERYSSELKVSVLVIEKRSHIGGNCYDYIDPDTNIRVSQYGAHLFHTNYEDVKSYVNQFGKWIKYEHKVRGIVNNELVPIPVNIETVNKLFDEILTSANDMEAWLQKEQVPIPHDDGQARDSREVALSRVGQRLYDLIFRPYTYKQWAKYPEELGPEVLSRIPVRKDHNDLYFSDSYQALPASGYTSIFERMLSSPLIHVHLDTDYFEIKDQLNCNMVYFTGPIDAYFAHMGWSKLEYRSLEFERVVVKDINGTFQPHFVVNYPQADNDFTRIVEYKHLPGNEKSDHTVYFIERSKDGGEPYYPVPNSKNKDLYVKYQELAEKEEGVTFVGRLANYKYFNMDEAIKNALDLFAKDTGIVFDPGNTVPGKRTWKRGVGYRS